MSPKKPTNPFFTMLVIAGVVFAMTASAYMVLTVRGLRPAGAEAPSGLMVFLNQYGARLLMVELGVLGVCTVLAMATDDYWTRRGGAE